MTKDFGVPAMERPLKVLTVGGGPATWRVEHNLETPWRLSIIGPTGERYEAIGPDLFDCLKQIRRETSRTGMVLCCNGARRNARPSGFMDDLGALNVYLIHRWRASLRRDLVDMFDYARPRTIGSVEEQEAYWRKVDSYRKSILAPANPVFWITYGFRLLSDWLAERRDRHRTANAVRSRGSGD